MLRHARDTARRDDRVRDLAILLVDDETADLASALAIGRFDAHADEVLRIQMRTIGRECRSAPYCLVCRDDIRCQSKRHDQRRCDGHCKLPHRFLPRGRRRAVIRLRARHAECTESKGSAAGGTGIGAAYGIVRGLRAKECIHEAIATCGDHRLRGAGRRRSDGERSDVHGGSKGIRGVTINPNTNVSPSTNIGTDSTTTSQDSAATSRQGSASPATGSNTNVNTNENTNTNVNPSGSGTGPSVTGSGSVTDSAGTSTGNTNTNLNSNTNVNSNTSGQASPMSPSSKDDCKDDGWQKFGFKNQGQCVSSTTSGKDRR